MEYVPYDDNEDLAAQFKNMAPVWSESADICVRVGCCQLSTRAQGMTGLMLNSNQSVDNAGMIRFHMNYNEKKKTRSFTTGIQGRNFTKQPMSIGGENKNFITARV